MKEVKVGGTQLFFYLSTSFWYSKHPPIWFLPFGFHQTLNLLSGCKSCLIGKHRDTRYLEVGEDRMLEVLLPWPQEWIYFLDWHSIELYFRCWLTTSRVWTKCLTIQFGWDQGLGFKKASSQHIRPVNFWQRVHLRYGCLSEASLYI